MKLPCSLCVCPSILCGWVSLCPLPLQLLNHLAEFHGTWYKYYATPTVIPSSFLLLFRALQSMMNLGLFYDCSPYVRLQSLKVSQQLKLFTGWGRQPHAQLPIWRARVSLFVWIITFDLSGMGGPTSSYATAGIALRIMLPRKPHHYVKVGVPTGSSSFLQSVITGHA
jgi:hypothetical protein